jgi:outer membrane protein OmpA-like peptidoglycan-associated protein
MSTDLETRHQAPGQTHWIPLADLMTGLMMVFLLIATSYMIKIEAASQHIREIAVLYERMKVELYVDLKKEFEKDLLRWGAEIDQDSTIRFKEPDVLFPIGSSDLSIATLLRRSGSRVIHQASGQTSSDQAYFQNMKLSQDRTRSTLQYVLASPAVRGDLPWLRGHITANGLSSSKTIKRPDGSEDYERSQQVEFRVQTPSHELPK